MKTEKMTEMIAGNILMACAIAIALAMGDGVGGTSGLSVILSRVLPLSQPFLLVLINGALFLAGMICVSVRFALKSIGSVILFPLLLGIAEKFSWTMMKEMNPLAGAVIDGILLGLSAGLIIDSGASTGGFDIPGIILQRKTGITPSVVMWAGDFIVIPGNSGFSMSSVYGLVISAVCALTSALFLHVSEVRMVKNVHQTA